MLENLVVFYCFFCVMDFKMGISYRLFDVLEVKRRMLEERWMFMIFFFFGFWMCGI